VLNNSHSEAYENVNICEVEEIDPAVTKESEVEAAVTAAVRKLYCKHNGTEAARESIAHNLNV
jgi:hypothetical protein